MMRMNFFRRYGIVGHNSSRIRLQFVAHAFVELALLIGLLAASGAVVGAWWLGLNLVGRAW